MPEVMYSSQWVNTDGSELIVQIKPTDELFESLIEKLMALKIRFAANIQF